MSKSFEKDKRTQRALAATIIGNVLEWYDFIVYGFMAVFIAKQFFPAGDETAALLATFAAFALTFVVRPISGVLIGIYSDRFGRRAALTFVMGIMMVAILIMVLVPPYSSIGIAATVLMVIARILAAASAGGEFASASVYLLESVPVKKRGLYSGLYSAGIPMAAVLAGVVGLVLSEAMSAEVRDSWGWRIPFAIGLLIAPIAYYIRRHIPESPLFVKNNDHRPLSTLAALFSNHRKGIVIGIALAATINASGYILLVYAPTYAIRTLQLPMYISFVGVIVSGLVGIVCTPLMGALADRVGALRLFIIGLIAKIVCIVPLYFWLNSNPSLTKLVACAALFPVITAISTSVMPTLMAPLFPTKLRSTGMALCYNTSAVVFGGASIFFILLLIEKTGNPLTPAYYLSAITVVCFFIVGLYYKRECSNVRKMASSAGTAGPL